MRSGAHIGQASLCCITCSCTFQRSRIKLLLLVSVLKLQVDTFYEPSSNFLVCASDDEVTGVHGNHICSELAGEMVLLVQISPLDI